jgi:hypothetical protein
MKDTGRLQDIDYSLKTAVKCEGRIGNMQHHPAAPLPQFFGNDHPIKHFCNGLFEKAIVPMHQGAPSILSKRLFRTPRYLPGVLRLLHR